MAQDTKSTTSPEAEPAETYVPQDIRAVQTIKHEGMFLLCDRYGDIAERSPIGAIENVYESTGAGESIGGRAETSSIKQISVEAQGIIARAGARHVKLAVPMAIARNGEHLIE